MLFRSPDFAYFDGEVKNMGDITLTNVMVTANLPEPDSILVGPISLAPGETQYFFSEIDGEISTLPILQVDASGMSICRGEKVTDTVSCGETPNLHFTSIETTDGGILLTWTATPGTTYRVQYVTDLASSEWMDLPGDVTATGSTASKTDSSTAERERFYRVVVVEPTSGE